MKNKIFIMFFLMFFLVCGADAEISPGAPESEGVKGRVPASLTKGYPKETSGMFEAQGFGEDYPEPYKLKEKKIKEWRKDEK